MFVYQLLDILNVRSWDINNPIVVNRLGTLARFTNLLLDYESVYKRSRPDDAVAGEQVGGHHGKCAGRVGLREKLGEIVNAARGVRVLHEHAKDRGGKIKRLMIADNKLNAQWLRAGADDIDGLRVAFF